MAINIRGSGDRLGSHQLDQGADERKTFTVDTRAFHGFIGLVGYAKEDLNHDFAVFISFWRVILRVYASRSQIRSIFIQQSPLSFTT